MPVITPSFSEILQAAQEQLQSRTGISNYTEGSVAGMITAMIATELRRVYDLIEQAEAARDIETATGDDLDNLARPFGILRRTAQKAGANSASPQVMVTNTTSAPIVLPSNLAFWSPSYPATRLYLASQATLSAGQSTAVYIQSSIPGQTYNIGIGQLTANNGPAGLVSTNFLPINGGAVGEDDDSFRYRITQTLQASLLGGPSSLAGVESVLLSLPGVLDVILLPQARGPATLDAVVVQEGGGLPDDDFLTSVQEQMARVCAAGVSVRAKAPDIIPVVVQVIVSADTSSSLINPTGSLRSLLTNLIGSYIDSRTVGLPSDSTAYFAADSASAPDISYSTLLASVTDACRSILGSGFRSVSLVLSLGNDGSTLQGDVYARPAEIFRMASVSVRLGTIDV